MRRFSTLIVAALVAASSSASAAVAPGLPGAQDLFRRNHWAEARAHLRTQWAALPAQDQPAARYLIGRSYVREAEFYGVARRVGVDVGRAYFKELAATRANRSVAWAPLFTAFYELEAGRNAEAERDLRAASLLPGVPPEWKAIARLRRGVALQRLGREAEAAPLLKDPSVEGRFWRLVLTRAADAAPLNATSRRERVLAAPILFRSGRSPAAESLLNGLDLDAPDAEARPDARKTLRFFDPTLAMALERVSWEQAAVALRPLAAGGTGVERTLASYYVGLSLFRLGAPQEAARYLKEAAASTPAPELQAAIQLLTAACTWQDRTPSAADLQALWAATSARPDSVLDWAELRRADLARTEPFATKLDARSKGLLSGLAERPSGAIVGRWALERLWRGDDPAPLLATLFEYRDDSNKNKIDWNDPVLLLALVAANERHQEYAQALETLFELSKTFSGLRWLQWNLQGVYAARQKAGGETRISQ